MSKIEKYELLLEQVESLIVKEIFVIGNVCNILALLKSELDLFWCGIYMRCAEDTLGLGPFQGLPACTVIKIGKGVCGTVAATGHSRIVDDVTQFPGYIACHAETASEIVLPGFFQGSVSFVLDIDSAEKSHFDETDREYLEKICRIIERLFYEGKQEYFGVEALN